MPLALSMFCARAGCAMWLCSSGSETDATMLGSFDGSYHDKEVAEVLHCLSPGTCSGHEAVLGRGQRGGSGLQPPAVPKILPVKMWLIQDFTLVTSE